MIDDRLDRSRCGAERAIVTRSAVRAERTKGGERPGDARGAGPISGSLVGIDVPEQMLAPQEHRLMGELAVLRQSE